MAKNLGKSKDGHPIIARGIAEDNSGVVIDYGNDLYKVSCSYPIGADYDDETGEETLYYDHYFFNRQEAVKALYDLIGMEKSYGQ